MAHLTYVKRVRRPDVGASSANALTSFNPLSDHLVKDFPPRN